MKTLIVVGILFAAYVAWLVHEIKRAPVFDEDAELAKRKSVAGEVTGGICLLFAMGIFVWLCSVGSGYNWQ